MLASEVRCTFYIVFRCLKSIKNVGALDEAKFRVLFSIADVDNTGTISFNEYVHFEDVINRPDAEYVLAFKIFDRDGNGTISKGTNLLLPSYPLICHLYFITPIVYIYSILGSILM
jgi:Ca2+-binding EF-hand superfamily protein